MFGSKPKPLILSGFSSQTLANQMAVSMETRVVDLKYKQHDDREIQTTIESNVRGREVIVVASASGDPNKQEKEARLLMRAANQSGAKSVTLLLPYMWYGRSDDNWDERNAPALIDTIETLRPHCDNVIIYDPHNANVTKTSFMVSGGRIKSCTVVHFAYLYAKQIKFLFNQNALNSENLLLAHADAGSTKRITRSFRNALYSVLDMDGNPDQDDWAQGMKDRDKKTGKSRVTGFSKPVAGKDVVIFEDIIASGGTACDLAKFLKKEGARSVLLFATSGLLTPKKGQNITASVERINESMIDAVYITDTYNHHSTAPKLHQAIMDSPIINVLNTAAYTGMIATALHKEVTSDDINDTNSISAILRGNHVDLKNNKAVFKPVPLKAGSPLLTL